LDEKYLLKNSVDHDLPIFDVIALRAFGVANVAQRSAAISPRLKARIALRGDCFGMPTARKAKRLAMTQNRDPLKFWMKA